MAPRSLPIRVAAYFRFGIAAGALAVAKRLVRRWVEWGTIVVCELPVRRRPLAPRLEVRTARRADLPLLAAAFDRPLAELAERLIRGDRGFVGWRDDTPVHLRWIASRPMFVPEVGAWIWPEPGTVYLYDARTRPGARGLGLAAAVAEAVDVALAPEGVRAQLLYIRADNHAMWRSLLKEPAPPVVRFRLAYLQRPGRPPRVLGRIRPPLGPAPPLDARASATV